MKKTSIAVALIACTTSVMAFDMSEWTRNTPTSNVEQAAPEKKQQGTDQTLKSQNIEERYNEIKTNINNSVKADQTRHAVDHNSLNSNQSKSQYSSIGIKQNNQNGVKGNNTIGSQVQNYNTSSNNDDYLQQSNQASSLRDGLPSDLNPQVANGIDREAAQVTAMLTQIMRMNTNGFKVSGKQKQALDSYNGALQMLGSIWASSTQAERNKMDFELYNYAVACTTKNGVVNQARSILGAYGQVGGMGGFTQHVQRFGKSLGTAGSTLGC